jgi:glycine dehydrogenase subunit 2
MQKNEPLIFELTKDISYPAYEVADYGIVTDHEIPEKWRQTSNFNIPCMPERELIKHYLNLSYENFGVDNGFYPLGSCTMKYNPKISEKLINSPFLSDIHPSQPIESKQGLMELLYLLSDYLKNITGMDYCNLEPAAGAQGELAGMLCIKNYLVSNGLQHKDTILIPDSAHGTNPASAVMAGFKVLQIPTDEKGFVNPAVLKDYINENTAGIMLTNPNTLGIFEKYISEISCMIHDAGGLLYYDGANFNANIGYTNPGIMGFDVVHLNLHKTFGTPHGTGGPGAGTVLIKSFLKNFSTGYYVTKIKDKFVCSDFSEDRLLAFDGNIDVLLKALIYIFLNGCEGLKKVSEYAVLNANYLKNELKEVYHLPYNSPIKHEFVINDKLQEGVTTLNIAKRLIDYDIHPPTIYFPLIVKSAMMIEPTETESKQTLDNFVKIMKNINEEVKNNTEVVVNAPNKTFISHPDETTAAKKPILVEPEY